MSKGTDPEGRGEPEHGLYIGEVSEWVGEGLESAEQRKQQRRAAPYEALWVACALIILHCCTGSDVEPRLVL